MLEVGDSVVGQVRQVVLHLLDILLDLLYLVVSLIRVETRDTNELQLGQALYIFNRNLSAQLRLERFQALVHRCVGLLARLASLDKLVEFVLDKDALQRCSVPSLVMLRQGDLQLLFQKPLGMLCRVAQNIAYAHKCRFVILDNAGIWRNRHLAQGEGVECVDSLVARLSCRHLHYNLCLACRIVIDTANLNLALLVGFEDGVFDTLGSCRERYLGNCQSILIQLGNLCSHLHCATTQTIVIARYIYHTSRWEVGVELELLASQMGDRCRNKLVEVVWQNLRCKTYGNTLGTLRQQKRELHRQGYRLLLTAIVRQHPLGSLLVIDHLQSELRQARLDISCCRSIVARKDISPVTLTVNQ